MKCSIFYKIGFSKNPKNRLKTVKTHNPLDVKIVATLKTDSHLSLEKELHNLFVNKNTRREWFELHQEDLLILKVNYGFNFLIPINKLVSSEVKNKDILNEIKEVRIDNSKLDYFKSYFEDLFCVDIKVLKELKKTCLKFDTDLIKAAIDSLYNQDLDANKSYNLIYKVCVNMYEIKTNPSFHVAKIVKAIMYKQYREVIHIDDISHIENNYNYDLDANDVIKTLNSKKFYLDEREFLDFVIDNYTV